ncbi:MAG: SDR family oxidoreductase [Deltaproteobacteria bacterium]|nr:SDR family oxidoreductase [Deltaproteobacteria bacterium]
MPKSRGKKVLITGAASGIGRCTAAEFARAGYDLILTDIDQPALERTASEIRGHGVQVHTCAYDVSKQNQVQEMARSVLAEVGGVDILVNNAGVGYTGELTGTSLKTWRKLIDVNLWGPIYHVYAFLPHMQQRGSGQIVNVSSGQAFFRLPTWGAYAAIKAALGVFSEILYYEVRKHGIRVTTVYPFMVNTPFYKNIVGETWAARLSMKLVPYYSMKPERVARIIFRAVERRRKIETVSLLNDLAFYAQAVPFAPGIIAATTNFVLGTRPQRGATARRSS